jgi:hypothetical protein
MDGERVWGIFNLKLMHMKIQKCLLVLLLSSCSFIVFAQEEEEEEEPKKGFDKEKLFFGGTFGASFGSYTFINVSPQVGYRFNRFFAAGTGINFIFSSSKYDYGNPNLDYKNEYGVVGLDIFGRVYPVEFLLVQAQPEMNYTWGKLKFYDGTPEQKLEAKFVPCLLVGGGAAIPIGGKGAMTVMLQYDVIQDVRSPYGTNPFLSIGFNF